MYVVASGQKKASQAERCQQIIQYVALGVCRIGLQARQVKSYIRAHSTLHPLGLPVLQSLCHLHHTPTKYVYYV